MHTINDPVMGGESYSSISTTDGDYLLWEGEVKIVKFLKAPGFCNLRTEPTDFSSLSESDTISFIVDADTDFMTPMSVNAQIDDGKKHSRGNFIMYSAALKSRKHDNNNNTIELYASWKDFVPTSSGRPVDDAPSLLDVIDKVNVIGLSTYQSHKAGKFRIELLQIQVSSTEKYIRGSNNNNKKEIKQ